MIDQESKTRRDNVLDLLDEIRERVETDGQESALEAEDSRTDIEQRLNALVVINCFALEPINDRVTPDRLVSLVYQMAQHILSSFVERVEDSAP